MIGRSRAKELVGKFAGREILVVGDLMLDRYVHGKVSRISPEAPVPVVRVTGEYVRPGGAANVALNVRSLGGEAVVAGFRGRDSAGDELEEILRRDKVGIEGLVSYDGMQTTVKTRIMADRQQVVRVDREDGVDGVPGEAVDELCARIRNCAAQADGVIIEDYGKGVVSQRVVDAALHAAREKCIPVALDPKDNHHLDISYLSVATPNYKEACMAVGCSEREIAANPEKDENLLKVGSALRDKWRAELLVITLGPHGMALFSKTGRPVFIPTNAREVFDVSGAGDTVVAAAELALVAGASDSEAAGLANYAAGVVVGKIGTAVCAVHELLEVIPN